MTVVAVILAVAAGGWLVVQSATGGWRRLVVRLLWPRICRSVGAAVRRDRLTSHKSGPGERTSPLQQVEHTPVLWGLWGRPVGRLRDGRMGATWRVWAAVGQTTTELAAMADRFASTTWCRRCVIEPESPRAAHVTLLWKDPFVRSRPWHPSARGRLRPAFRVDGSPVDVPILNAWGGSWLIGAASGSGKSAWVNAIVADLVRQPHVYLVGVDLKAVELQPWRPAFARVATTASDGDLILDWVRQHIDRRMADLTAAGMRCVPDIPTVDWPFVALVVDEVAVWLSAGPKDDQDRRRAVFSEVAMLARAAGVILVCALQRPTVDAIPAQVRDNLQRRVLLRVANLTQAEAVLGWRPDQATIDQLDVPGLGYCDLPGEQPFLARSTYLDTAEVIAFAHQHARLQEVAA